MVFKTTSTRVRRAGQRALTLVDLMVATSIASVVFAMTATSFMFQVKSFVGLSNYVDLDQKSRNAVDTMSQQIRACHWLKSYNTTSLTFEDYDGKDLVFSYDPNTRLLTRTKNGVADARPLLTECDLFQFGIYQRNPIGGTYDQFPTAVATNTKLVQLTWMCSRKILGTKMDTESVQSAKIVIRTK